MPNLNSFISCKNLVLIVDTTRKIQQNKSAISEFLELSRLIRLPDASLQAFVNYHDIKIHIVELEFFNFFWY